MTRSRTIAALATVSLMLVAAPGAEAAHTTALRLSGIGPVTLGMTRADAVATGWLGNRGRGCPLSSPAPVTYRFSGPKAPSGLSGSAEFVNGKLADLTFTRGVRTAAGVHIGTTASRMAARYRALGFNATARYVGTFQGTFVTVKRNGTSVVGGFGRGGRVSILAVPAVPVCE